ncbi:MAG TPA: NAD(P)H-binding protein [Polyangiales bacterium]|nr:NAD(P)H-binding protein [Polyangiales bacterium]
MPEIRRVLLTGATGFIGTHLYSGLIESGFAVVSGSRDPERAQRKYRGRAFVRLDLNDYHSLLKAMEGCQAAVYLVHSMAEGPGYEEQEQRAAMTFARAAEQAGLQRIVYLGGIQPQGVPSRHLRSRLRTGELLRSSRVSTIELQAAMVIGPASESWRIVRDLAARLPLMVLPRWLESRSQPVYIDDVTAAIRHALTLDVQGSAAFALPGPETLSAREILQRTARLMGLEPPMVQLPVITPRLSAYWISLVTRANSNISRQLVEGLRTDLVAADEGFWKFMPEHRRVPFDEAARRALYAEAQRLPLRARLTEWLLHRFTPAHEKQLDKSGASGATL